MTTSENIETILELTTIQKKKLRGLGHHLEPVVYVGKEGVSKPLQQSLAAALKARELVKIKLGQTAQSREPWQVSSWHKSAKRPWFR